MSSVLDSNKNIHISVSLTTDQVMQDLNKKYKNKDCPTDVLSFAMEDNLEDEGFYLGDVIVNKDQAKRQAFEYDNTLEEEIAALVQHGILHLLGVHHKEDA